MLTLVHFAVRDTFRKVPWKSHDYTKVNVTLVKYHYMYICTVNVKLFTTHYDNFLYFNVNI